MNLKPILKMAGKTLEKNLPTILTVTGISGFIGAAIVSAKVTGKYLEEKQETDPQEALDKVKLIGKHYWPVIVGATCSSLCIVSAHSISLKRQGAALAAYSLSQANLKEYKDAVVQTLGDKKSEEVKAKVAANKIKDADTNTIIFTGSGENLCYDAVSGRYFKSSIEKVKQAVNELNKLMLNEGSASLNDFYDILGLNCINVGDSLGWDMHNTGDYLEINFSSQLTKDGEPCLVLEYTASPMYWGID